MTLRDPKMNYYHAFMMAIGSDLEIPEFDVVDPCKVDVTVYFGAVENSPPKDGETQGTWWARANEVVISIKGVARYLVRNGCEIVVDKADGATDAEVCGFLLGSAFAAVLQQRGVLPLHASSIATEKGAILFLGKSGFGKSTLAGQFARLGYQVMSDDVTGVTVEDGGVFAIPSYPSSRMTQTSLDHLEIRNQLEKVPSSVPKFNVPIARHLKEKQPIYAICVLSLEGIEEPTIRPLRQSVGMNLVAQFTYRGNFMKGMGLLAQRFEMAADISKSVKFFLAERPVNQPSFDSLQHLISDALGLSK